MDQDRPDELGTRSGLTEVGCLRSSRLWAHGDWPGTTFSSAGAAVETLGAINFLCVDKARTLTENRMTVAAIWTAGAMRSPDARFHDADVANVLTAAALSSAIYPVDPLDVAIRALVPQVNRDNGITDETPLRTCPLQPDLLAVINAGKPGNRWSLQPGARPKPSSGFAGSSRRCKSSCLLLLRKWQTRACVFWESRLTIKRNCAPRIWRMHPSALPA